MAFFQLIVSGPRLMAAGANGPRTLSWTHGDFDAFVIRTESGVLINESGKTVTTIQNRDELKHESDGENYREVIRAASRPCHDVEHRCRDLNGAASELSPKTIQKPRSMSCSTPANEATRAILKKALAIRPQLS